MKWTRCPFHISGGGEKVPHTWRWRKGRLLHPDIDHDVIEALSIGLDLSAVGN